MGSRLTLESGSVVGIPLVPPSQPTQAPGWAAMTGRRAVTRPPGASSQPSSPRCRGSRFATAITGLSSPGVTLARVAVPLVVGPLMAVPLPAGAGPNLVRGCVGPLITQESYPVTNGTLSTGGYEVRR